MIFGGLPMNLPVSGQSPTPKLPSPGRGRCRIQITARQPCAQSSSRWMRSDPAAAETQISQQVANDLSLLPAALWAFRGSGSGVPSPVW